MALNATALELMVSELADAITHIGLVDDNGDELTGGTPAYARVAVTWTADGDGVRRPNADLDFDIPASTIVAGWQGYSASSGGTAYGIIPVSQRAFTLQGTYRLLAAQTSIALVAS